MMRQILFLLLGISLVSQSHSSALAEPLPLDIFDNLFNDAGGALGIDHPFNEVLHQINQSAVNTERTGTEALVRQLDLAVDQYGLVLKKLESRLLDVKSNSVMNKYAFETLKLGGEAIKIWANSQTLSDRAANLRRVFAIAKLLNVSSYLANEISSKGHFDYFWYKNLRAAAEFRIPCHVIADRPSIVAEAFLTPFVYGNESKPDVRRLYEFFGRPIHCPLLSLTPTKQAHQLSIDDFTRFYRFYSGEGLRDFYSEVVKDDHSQVSTTLSGSQQVVSGTFDYKARIGALNSSDKPRDILERVLLIHSFENDTASDRVASALDGLLESVEPPNVSSGKPSRRYDGSDELLVKYLRYLSVNGLGGRRVVIPCPVLIRRPQLLEAVRPYFGGSLDNAIPDHDCSFRKYPLPGEVLAYFDLVKSPITNWMSNYQGTLRYSHWAGAAEERLRIHVFPRELLKHKRHSENEFPYQTWSYLNLGNRLVYEEIRLAFLQAHRKLKTHYEKTFALSRVDAAIAADNALWLPIKEGHWGSAPRKGLRRMIMDGAPFKEIEGVVNSVDDLVELEPSLVSMSAYNGQWVDVGPPEPLTMVSVNRPNVLRLLLNKKNSFQLGKFDVRVSKKLGLSNQATDVDSANYFGKTAIFTAVQQNNLKSVKILLSHGANLELTISWHRLLHSNRTLAMYAAANADLELIRFLKERGVSFAGADSRGYRALDYLLGARPLKANPHINVNNIAEYVTLIDPNIAARQLAPIAPSFDCTKALNTVERTICDQPLLSISDRVLNVIYKECLHRMEGDAGLRKAQTTWLRQRNKCESIGCIEGEYERRIDELRSLPALFN